MIAVTAMTVFIYDRSTDPLGEAPRARMERCAEYAALRGWPRPIRWMDDGDRALTLTVAERPRLADMLSALGVAPGPRFVLLASWVRLAPTVHARRALAREVLATGAAIETTDGDRLTPADRDLVAALVPGPVIL